MISRYISFWIIVSKRSKEMIRRFLLAIWHRLDIAERPELLVLNRLLCHRTPPCPAVCTENLIRG